MSIPKGPQPKVKDSSAIQPFFPEPVDIALRPGIFDKGTVSP